MPKAGKYDYPTRDLDDCIGYLEKAHKISNALSISRENFAKAIDLSPKGGGYGLILSSLAMYGLIDSSSGNINYTDLAQKILFGQPEERSNSKSEAIRKVTILADLFDKYQSSNPSEEQLRFFLREKANVPISEEAEVASEVGKLLKRNAQHFKAIGGEKKPMSGQIVVPNAENALVTLTRGPVTIPVMDRLTLGLAKKLLEDIEKEMESSEKAGKKEQKEVK